MADQNESVTIVTGVTLRDWFAAQALQGILSSDAPWSSKKVFTDVDDVCGYAYEYAEAMIRARAKKK